MTTSAAPASFDHLALEERFERISIKALVPSPTNPRKHFATIALDDLTHSIREKGVLEPLIVRPRKGLAGKDAYEIVAGERRWRAATQAGQLAVGCIIRNYTDDQALEVQLLENIQRKDLTPLEAAAGFRALIDKHPDRHSAASIATRTGMSITWVWETLSLNNLIAAAKTLLEAERITKGHALLIAAQTPADQKRIVEIEDAEDLRHHERRGLWQADHARRLALEEADEAGTKPKKADPYAGLKPVSIAELASWIDDNIRFDLAHVVKAQPLDFGALAAHVDLVEKTVPITFSYHLAEDARDDKVRTYSASSWQRADGLVNPGEKKKSQMCEYSVLGLVVAGRGRGQAFQVCVNREKCKVHFKESALAAERRKKAAKVAAKAPAGKPAKPVKAKGPSKAELAAKARRDADERDREAWAKLQPLLEKEAFAQLTKLSHLDTAAARLIMDGQGFEEESARAIKAHLGATWFKSPAAALAIAHLASELRLSDYDEFAKECKTLGVDVKKLAAIRDAHAAEPAKKT